MSLARLALALGYGAGAVAPAGGAASGAVRMDAELAELAAREQVAPLLGKRLLSGDVGCGGADSHAADLVRAYRECTAKGLLRERSAAPILAAVRERGVPIMWLKGAALVRMVYGDPGVRWMGDLDVLVPADRWRDARAAALAAGAESMAVPGRAVTADHDYVAAVRAPGGAVIEWHRYFGPRPLFAVDYGAVIAAGREDGDGFLLPDPADLFVSLAVHAAKHGFILPFRAIVDGLALATPAAGASTTTAGASMTTAGASTTTAGGQVMLDAARVEASADAWRARRATAVWLTVLLRYGLPTDPWAEVARRLAGGRIGGSLAAALARHAPYAPSSDGTLRGWPRLARIAASADGPGRAAGYLLQRIALRAGDAVHALRHR